MSSPNTGAALNQAGRGRWQYVQDFELMLINLRQRGQCVDIRRLLCWLNMGTIRRQQVEIGSGSDAASIAYFK